MSEHLISMISGIPGTGYNDWSHAVPAPLGCLIKVIGVENMVVGIFKYA